MAQLIESLAESTNALGESDIVELTWLERSRPRLRCKSANGRELALALPRGTVLSDGDVLINSQEATITVKAKAEPVVVIQPSNSRETCMVAHQLGNWHREMEYRSDDSILTEFDAPLETWLKRNKIAYRLDSLPYHPDLKAIQHEITVSL